MKKELEIKPYLFPMPVLMIATYGENDRIDVMNIAWGGICAPNMVSLRKGWPGMAYRRRADEKPTALACS